LSTLSRIPKSSPLKSTFGAAFRCAPLATFGAGADFPPFFPVMRFNSMLSLNFLLFLGTVEAVVFSAAVSEATRADEVYDG
jgi:hypothetical protein